MAKKKDDWLNYLRLWPILMFVMAIAGAAGAQQLQLHNQDMRLKHIEGNNQSLKTGQATINERTKIMREEQKLIRQDIKNILEEILQSRR